MWLKVLYNSCAEYCQHKKHCLESDSLYSSLDIIKAIQYRRVTLVGHVGCTEEIRRATEFYLENLKGRDHFGNTRVFEYSRINYIYKPN